MVYDPLLKRITCPLFSGHIKFLRYLVDAGTHISVSLVSCSAVTVRAGNSVKWVRGTEMTGTIRVVIECR